MDGAGARGPAAAAANMLNQVQPELIEPAVEPTARTKLRSRPEHRPADGEPPVNPTPLARTTEGPELRGDRERGNYYLVNVVARLRGERHRLARRSGELYHLREAFVFSQIQVGKQING